MALLLPDPCDPHCPEEFRRTAISEIKIFAGHIVGTKIGSERLVADLGAALRSSDTSRKKVAEREANRRLRIWRGFADTKQWSPERIRSALLQFVASGSSWWFATDDTFLTASRNLVHAAHPDGPPLIVDTFAGGGSIPIEALRLGCDAFGSDLNPVAGLILKVMLEDIPRLGPGLAHELRRAGLEVKSKVAVELAGVYPRDPDGAVPMAYLWARTVRCESPSCGTEIPLMRSMWLSKKAKRKRALRPIVRRNASGSPSIEIEVFEPQAANDVPTGTVSGAKATCISCGSVLPQERVRAQIAAQRGGADVVFDQDGARIGGARMTAVVTLSPDQAGRQYRVPTDADYAAVRLAQQRVANVVDEWERGGKLGLSPVPDEPLPPIGTLGFRVQRYGMLQWGDLFTARQKMGLVELGRAVGSMGQFARPLSLAIGKLADLANTICPWEPGAECPRNVLSNGRIKPGWDFAEGVVTSDASGGFTTCVDNLANGIESLRGITTAGQSEVYDAQKTSLPSECAPVWFIDPPYYDSIPFSDLSDFFLVWLKRTLADHHPSLQDPFDPDNSLSPKNSEAVQDESKIVNGRPKDRAWFEETMANAFAEGRRVLSQDGIGAVVFAHSTTEGWEALLSGMVRGGWTITGSWPIATESRERLRARESAALATSVHLICRPRAEDAPIGDWADVLRELPVRVSEWMQRLQGEGIRGADLVFACVGPALEIFSRYSRVETPEGSEVRLREYLERVWEVVGREALEQVLGTAEAQAMNGMAGALEEDARLTALFLWTMQSAEDVMGSDNGGGDNDTSRRNATSYSLPFDVVRRFAQPLGIHLDDWQSRIIDTSKGVVRLTPVRERSKQLFGEAGADNLANEIESSGAESAQLTLFPESAPTVRGRSRRGGQVQAMTIDDLDASLNATTLDRVHAAMLLLASGRTEALRALLRSEQERGPDFLRLANALSALYPRGSDEKRLLDAMLLAAPR